MVLIHQIETLGDTYMLASGPSHNKGHWQAQQVAVYALTVMQEMKYFTIPHRANVPVFLRIGIHAGSVRKTLAAVYRNIDTHYLSN